MPKEPKKPRSIDSGSLDWGSRYKKIVELRLENSNSSGHYDLQDVHDDYVEWLKKTPKAVDYDALAANDIDRADRADRPLDGIQGTLWEADDDSQIPFGHRMRVPLKKAGPFEILGWQQVVHKNKTDVDNKYNHTMQQITEVLIAFQEHPHCKTFAALKKELKPPAEEKGA